MMSFKKTNMLTETKQTDDDCYNIYQEIQYFHMLCYASQSAEHSLDRVPPWHHRSSMSSSSHDRPSTLHPEGPPLAPRPTPAGGPIMSMCVEPTV